MGVKLCGWRLAETLQMICKEYGGFYSSNYRMMRDTSPVLDYGRHFRSRRGRQQSSSRITKRGVVDECCRKHCFFQDIMAYCANPGLVKRSTSESEMSTNLVMTIDEIAE
ncbi:hypothetical protein CDAR_271491 [Caerostris darwini]|uniref:Insulin-like domain-containing protein n=1 Tax=Caerostris darwini TaxID=1538125 RepID=A0AAV4T703_9ARAC|nr:hypothetical protein CDAR_271491 [Caerostris darwini]